MLVEKRSGNLHKASSILSVSAILLTIALFMRMQTVVDDMKMMDSKFTMEIPTNQRCSARKESFSSSSCERELSCCRW